MRIVSAENPRFPGLGLSSQGKAGPKPRAKAGGDGQPVNIPVPRRDVMYDCRVDREANPSIFKPESLQQVSL